MSETRRDAGATAETRCSCARPTPCTLSWASSAPTPTTFHIAERIDLEPIKAYLLRKKNVEGIEFKYTFFHVIVAALVKTITLRPKLNRFYANENYHQRNKVTAGFIIKKEFSDGGSEAVALLTLRRPTPWTPFTRRSATASTPRAMSRS